MNHYCTYFDHGFLVQGLALAASLKVRDPESVLWVLCLDTFTHEYLERYGHEGLRPVALAELEQADPALLSVKPRRGHIDYYFTLSPCWPRYLLRRHPEIDRITYVDADLFFFDNPEPIFREMGEASILVTEHRYPRHLQHHARFGRFNVGLLSFRNDEAGRGCLDHWREQCLDWCFDRAEHGKYGDQKYLDDWPLRYGERLRVLRRPGTNLAPWNWSQYRFTSGPRRLHVDGEPVECYHFARFAPLHGTRVFQSGQLEYGIMPWGVRQWIYGRYWRALRTAADDVQKRCPGYSFPQVRARRWHRFWTALVPRLTFGSDWLRIGPWFVSGRLGLGRYSGQVLSFLRSAVSLPLRQLLSPRRPLALPIEGSEAHAVMAAPRRDRE